MTRKTRWLSSGLLAATLLLAGLPGAALAEFTAYNDCMRITDADLSGNITTNRPGSSTGSYGAISGALIDYASGSPVNVQADFSGMTPGGILGGGDTPPTAGSDAYNTFNGIISPTGYVYWASGDVTLNLTGLDPANRYDIVVYASRCTASTSYDNRSMISTIEGATSFTNASTSGATISQTTVANDTTTITAGNLNGYVVRFTGVNPGDSTFSIRMRSSDGVNSVYLNAFKVVEHGGSVSTNTGSHVWRRAERTAVIPSTSALLYLYVSNNSGVVFIDDFKMVTGAVAESGADQVVNGGFESGTNNWEMVGEHAVSLVTTARAHTGTRSLQLQSSGTTAGGSANSVKTTINGFTTDTTVTYSFWYLATNSVNFVSRFSGVTMTEFSMLVEVPAGGTTNSAPATPSAPAIANGAATVLSTTSASLPGNLTSTGMLPTQVSLYWKAGSDGGTTEAGWPNVANMGYRTVGSISTNISGLSSNTTYYFRYAAVNSQGTTWASPAGSFLTPAGVVTSTVALSSADKRQQYPSTRRTGIIISEIMYNPPYPYSNDLEFVELFNAESVNMDLSMWRLAGDVDFLFPSNTVMPPRTYWVVAKNPALVQSVYGLSASIVKGPYTNTLSNGSGSINLKDERGAVLLETKYSESLPWPSAADGAGSSLVLARPDLGEGNAAAWDASTLRYGNPGNSNRYMSSSYTLKNICINEFLAHTDPPQEDFVELYNKSSSPVTLDGCFISDSAKALTKYQIPIGTTIAGKGVVRFRASTLGFGLSMAGGGVYLMNPSGDAILDAVKYDAQENGVPMGRWPDGQPGFQELTAVTENASNNGTTLKVRDVVINEIMFAPISGDDNDEYIELHNKGGSAVSLASWRFIQGIDFTFPTTASIPAGGYVVVAKDVSTFLSHYTNISASIVFGGYGGSLADGSERVVLAKPDDALLPNQDFVAVDEVVYDDAWGQWTDAGGSSLELKHPSSDNSRAMNWAGSDETTKAAWCTLTETEVLDNEDVRDVATAIDDGFPYLEQVQVFLSGAGECLIDDVSVIKNGTEYMKNKSLDGSSDWIIQGNHRNSSIVGGGVSGNCMQLRAISRGEYRISSLGANLNDGINPNDTLTMSLKARWLGGHPLLNFRINGNGMWVAQVLDVPKNLGTPGRQNSRYANPGPALDVMTQSPILPPASQNTAVSVRVHDPDGISAVNLKWQVDGQGWNTAGMNDSGTGLDAVSGDGLWTGQINGQSASTVVGYYIEATDTGARTTRYPTGLNMSTNECLMIFGQDNKTGCGDYGVMRMIIRPSLDQANSANAFINWDRMDGSSIPISIIYNDSRMVHGAGTRISGSIWSRPKPGINYWGQTTENFRKMEHTWRISMPKNDRICDSATFVMDALNYTSRGRYFTYPQDGVFIRERLLYWTSRKMGLPTSHQRYWHIFFNDYHKGIVHGDAMLPDEGSMETHVPDQPNGDLYELKGWYDGNKTLGNNDNTSPGWGCGVQKYFMGQGATPYQHDDGRLRQEMFRFVWDKKINGPTDDSVESLARVAQAIGSPIDTSANGQRTYFKRVSQVLDPEQWGRSVAFRSASADGDTLCLGGRNKYLYVPVGGRAMVLDYDLDWGFGQEGATNAFTVDQINADGNYTTDVTMRDHFWACNAMMRAYWRGMKTVVDDLWATSVFTTELNNLHSGHVANNIIYWKGRGDSGRQNNFSYDNWGTWTTVNNGDAIYDEPVMTSSNLAAIQTWVNGRSAYIRSSGRLDSGKTNVSFTANGGALNGKILTMTGDAPIQARWIKVNGAAVPDEAIAWTSVTQYDLQYVVTNAGSTTLQVTAWDEKGVQVGSTRSVAVNYSGSMSSPLGNLVINEVMYDSGLPQGGFIEIYNKNGSEGFNLSGMRINGAEFTFPAGSYLAPSSYGVVVAGMSTFHNTYTNSAAVLGEYTGSLDNGGETISLEQPQVGAGYTNWIVLDTVRYDDDRPWAAEAKSTGYALQLIDANEDNNRCGNWAISRKWQKFTATGVANSQIIYLSVNGTNEVYIDDMKLVAGSTADVGVNLISNGDFEAGFPGAWRVGEAYRFSEVIKGASHGGTHSLLLKNLVLGAGGSGGVVQDVPAVNGATYTLSFWYLAPPEGTEFSVRFSGNWIATGQIIQSGLAGATPGRVNNVTADIAAVPTLWINEIMPNNTSASFRDNMSESEPWLELYNTSAGSYDMVGGNFYLTDDYDNMTKWKFSTAQSIAAGGRLTVWLDNETGENAAGYPHAGFRLGNGTGTVALVQINAGRTTVVDYVNYTFIPTNKSYGCWPDGDILERQLFDTPTPGAVNNPVSTVITLKINEWLAEGDVGGFPDPSDGDFDDWFEIYNPNGAAVDVSGYSVTDDPLVTNKYVIPAGWVIPANGFMRIWADNETGQNGAGLDVHANFKLGASAGSIRLYAGDGRLVDSISYGLQSKNVSEGRYTDGGTEVFKMGIPTPKAANRMFEVTAATVNTNGTMSMKWNTLPGREYQVVYVTLPGSTNWVNLYGTNLPAGTNTTLNTVLPTTSSKRFYRLIQK